MRSGAVEEEGKGGRRRGGVAIVGEAIWATALHGDGVTRVLGMHGKWKRHTHEKQLGQRRCMVVVCDRVPVCMGSGGRIEKQRLEHAVRMRSD